MTSTTFTNNLTPIIFDEKVFDEHIEMLEKQIKEEGPLSLPMLMTDIMLYGPKINKDKLSES